MAIEDLVAVVSPPDHPIDAGPLASKANIINDLGISLPNDAYDFGLRYGTGWFADTVQIYNPFSPDYLGIIHEVCETYRDLKKSEGNSFIPYDIYPVKPGLLVWGSDVNGHMMFWLTEGEPSQWPIVLRTVDGQFERWPLQMTAFMAKLFNGESGCLLWDKQWVKQNFVGIEFHPG